MIFRHLLNMPSHPTWVRGLKRFLLTLINTKNLSHPTWVRGLKQLRAMYEARKECVAPYVGAWIETIRYDTKSVEDASHPTWVRGLKLNKTKLFATIFRSHPTWVRGLKLLIV